MLYNIRNTSPSSIFIGVGEVHFEVYGSHGIFQHGFMYLKNHHEGSALKNELKLYADLRDKNYDWVKNFVDKYRILMENYEGEWRKDTLSNSIMAPVVGSSSIRESYLPPEPEFGGSSQLSFGCTTGTFPMIETGGRGGLTRPKKTGLAAKVGMDIKTKEIVFENLAPSPSNIQPDDTIPNDPSAPDSTAKRKGCGPTRGIGLCKMKKALDSYIMLCEDTHLEEYLCVKVADFGPCRLLILGLAGC
ncbi:hypothetical protein COCNU_03G003780 [Cocos nucifera]|uniref:Uncharacterized protein n=1 Tax=Cocos nucifera TaxID=13894 RepID=A0A8K0MYD3_COCNU|nr:hypothetical protein COCNU_03G003780 [Cocos nucifera]